MACVGLLFGIFVGFVLHSSMGRLRADSLPVAVGLPLYPADLSAGCGLWLITDHEGKDHVLSICKPYESKGKLQPASNVTAGN
jgi:hypothetical protein